MASPTALIIDQDPDVRARISDYLRSRGYLVRAVASRSEGFDMLDMHAPELLVLDDPAHEGAYRLIWLKGDREDAAVELLDMRPGRTITQALRAVLDAAA